MSIDSTFIAKIINYLLGIDDFSSSSSNYKKKNIWDIYLGRRYPWNLYLTKESIENVSELLYIKSDMLYISLVILIFSFYILFSNELIILLSINLKLSY
ncbi:MAG: hypothetical protein ACP5GJ_04480, partial [Nanopusillaceae archaeon]